MRFAARMIVIACLAAAVLVPAAAAADRMWVGFQDDPMFRWDPQRMEAMDQARGNNARIVRTVVDWSRAAADRPANPTNSFDPAYNFGDVDELVRNAQQRGMARPPRRRRSRVHSAAWRMQSSGSTST